MEMSPLSVCPQKISARAGSPPTPRSAPAAQHGGRRCGCGAIGDGKHGPAGRLSRRGREGGRDLQWGPGTSRGKRASPLPPAARHPPESRYRCGKVSLPPASKRKWSRTCGKSRSSRPGPAGWAAAGGNRQHRDTGSACRRRPTARPSAGQPRAPGAARSDRTLPPGRGGSGRRGGGNEGSRLEHPPGAPRTGSRSERTKRSSCGERVPIAASRSAPLCSTHGPDRARGDHRRLRT